MRLAARGRRPKCGSDKADRGPTAADGQYGPVDGRDALWRRGRRPRARSSRRGNRSGRPFSRHARPVAKLLVPAAADRSSRSATSAAPCDRLRPTRPDRPQPAAAAADDADDDAAASRRSARDSGARHCVQMDDSERGDADGARVGASGPVAHINACLYTNTRRLSHANRI